MREHHAGAGVEWLAGARRGAGLGLLVLLAVAGCRDGDLPGEPPTGSGDPMLGTYQAVAVDGSTVPFAVGSQGTCGVQHLGGTVRLLDGMAYTSRLRRLRTTCPNGVTQETELASGGSFHVSGDSLTFHPGGSSDPFFGSMEAGALHLRHSTGDYVLVKQ